MKPVLNIVVVDDEPLALEVLQEYLKKIDPVYTVSLFRNAENALFHLVHRQADVLLLDIEMPGMTGLEFLRRLPEPPLTIFTTAYRNYAFEGFELGVIDFLLKPISFQRFSAAMDKVKDFLRLKTEDTKLEAGEQQPGFIFVKSGTQRIKLYFDQTTHIQGLKDYAIIHTSDQKIVVKGSVKMMQDIFPSSQFVRVHKSFLVSVKSINRIERNKIIFGNQQIPIGRNYREELEKILSPFK